jgi:deoxyribonuclease-4
MTARFRFSDTATDLIGAHLSTKGGLLSVFDRALAIDAAAIAMFAKNSNQWKGKVLPEEDAAAFRLRLANAGAPPLLTHASYLINLATTNEQFHQKSIAAMIDELERAERLGAYAVVLHPGAHLGRGVDAGIDQIARSLDRIHRALPECNVVTLLETAAGQGSCLGCSFGELAGIIRSVDEKSRIGVCFDTCHVFAAGYELRSRDGYKRTVDELIAAIGLENVGAFHLNDSKKELGSRVDRHEHIGEGAIGLEAFGFLLNDPRFRDIPKVLETPKPVENESDILNLKKLRGLIAPL